MINALLINGAYNIKMNKSLLLLCLLCTFTFQQVVYTRSQLAIETPTSSPPQGSNQVGSSKDGQATVRLLDSAPQEIQQQSSFSYRSTMQAITPEANSGQNWIIPEGAQRSEAQTQSSLRQQIVPPWRWARYDFKFYTECPDAGAWIWVNAPGAVWIFVNGQLVTGGIWPYPGGRWVYIPSRYLRCGCNTVRIYVWGVWPWLSYGTWLPPQSCAEKCESNPLAFYNRRQCRCECLRKCCRDGYYRSSALPCQCIRRSIIPAYTAVRPAN